MRIGLDTRPLFFTTAGIARYTRDLSSALLRLDTGNDFALLCPKLPDGIVGIEDIPETAWKVVRFPLRNRVLETVWQEFLLPRAVNRLGLDVVHYPRYAAPYRRNRPSVVTVHDVAFHFRDDILPPERKAEFTEWTQTGTARADAVITVSEQTKTDLIDWLDLDPDKVFPVHNGISPHYGPGERTESEASVAEHLNIKTPYLLYLGTIEPRKNLVGLITAYGRLSADTPPLLLGGAKGWLTDPIYQAASESPAADRIRFLDFVPEALLPDLYRAAAAFVFPSHYEGFGLPAIEAMACGTPVVTSNVSSLPEICGSDAVYVDPSDPDSIADGIRRVLDDTELAERLRSSGPVRASTFTWDRAARETEKVYRYAAGAV